MYLFCEHSTNGTSASLKGEQNFSIICDLNDSYKTISPKPFALCFRNVLSFMQKTLYLLQACEGYVFAYITGRFVVKKVQFVLGFGQSRRQSKSRKDCTFFGTARSSDELGTERIWSCYNKRWIMVLFRYPHAAVWNPSKDKIPEKIK
jgi:hypothetical protein